jgi:GWxTD domain-containing protein
MHRHHLFAFFFTLLVAGLPQGCATSAKSFKETTLDDLYPILSGQQYDSLKSIERDDDIRDFVEVFWHQVDSVSGVSEGASRVEFASRLVFANEHFPDRRGYGRSDRKRIYLLYGPPKTVTRKDFIDVKLDPFTTVKAVEVWHYLEPQHVYSFPSVAEQFSRSELKFVFGDLTGQGNYKLLFSGDEQSDIDSRLFIK